MISPEIAHALKTMEPGTHGVLIYDSNENKRDVLFSHLRYGQEDSKLVYVCSEEKPEQITDEMKTHGIDVGGLKAKDRLTISNYDEVYIGRDGSVDIPNIIDGFAKLAWGCSRGGLRMRASAEMSCFFRRGKLVELVEYENALGKRFYFPGMGMCAYNVVEMQSAGCLDMLMPLLRAHGPVILTGPKGGVVMESERVRPTQVEQVLHVRI
jgi:MEDS: MEthanogen/methylotroph, DcmR Sensory domain